MAEHAEPTTDRVEDIARFTLQEWLPTYQEDEDGTTYRVLRVGEFGTVDIYRFEPADERHSGKGKVFRVQVIVELHPEDQVPE